jgi:hypothetical protein
MTEHSGKQGARRGRADEREMRTIKPPAKPGTLRRADVDRAVEKVRAQRLKSKRTRPSDSVQSR